MAIPMTEAACRAEDALRDTFGDVDGIRHDDTGVWWRGRLFTAYDGVLEVYDIDAAMVAEVDDYPYRKVTCWEDVEGVRSLDEEEQMAV